MFVAATMAFVASFTGCKPHDELVVDVVCETVCPCLVDPEDVDACRAECQAELDPADVPDACFGCVLEASTSCSMVFACDSVCDF